VLHIYIYIYDISNLRVKLPVLRNYSTLDHPTHSSDLTPSDYHPSAMLKQNVGGNRFEDYGEVKIEVTC